jgi:cell wall assembly regulator SMI1
MSSDQLWDRYEAMLKKYHPIGYETLQPAATESEIEEAEKVMKIRFPKELKNAYRRHNGTKRFSAPKSQILFAFENWGSLDSVINYWKTVVSQRSSEESKLI